MFQTEPILWLQSMHGDTLTFLMRTASMLVNDMVFLVLGLIVFFCFDHRKGYALLFTLLWVALLTAALKSFFALPRPSDADMRVLLLETGLPNSTPFFSEGAASLLGLPSTDVVAHVRAMRSPDFGFPSGHCSSTVAFWGILAFLFRKKWITATAIGLVLIMPLSRMYLGRHFVGDTLGGILLGGTALLCFVIFAPRIRAKLQNPSSPVTPPCVTPLLVIGLIVLPVLPLFFSATRTFAASLLAFGVVFFATGRLRTYDSNRTLISRILLTVLALTTIGVLQVVLRDLLPRSIGNGLVVICIFGLTSMALGVFTSRNRLRQNA